MTREEFNKEFKPIVDGYNAKLLSCHYEAFNKAEKPIEYIANYIKFLRDYYLITTPEDDNTEDAKMFFSAVYDHPEEDIDDKALKHEIARALKALTPRQALILKELYFGDEPKTMQAVADELGVSRQRVDQIQKQSLAILKSKLLASPTFRALR